MSRTADRVAEALLRVRPSGFAGASEPDTYTAAHDWATAEAWATIEASAEAMLPEVDPRQAYNLLPDYERVLGPDPCGRDQLDLTAADRRALAHQRWTAGGAVCAGYFERMAADLGVTLTIDEFPLAETGFSVAGDELVGWPTHCEFLVTLPATRVWDPICGEVEAGDPLGGFTANLMECVIRHEAPLHSNPRFFYV